MYVETGWCDLLGSSVEQPLRAGRKVHQSLNEPCVSPLTLRRGQASCVDTVAPLGGGSTVIFHVFSEPEAQFAQGRWIAK